jgi:hypothetical protein
MHFVIMESRVCQVNFPEAIGFWGSLGLPRDGVFEYWITSMLKSFTTGSTSITLCHD